jgi:hypothetical protein
VTIAEHPSGKTTRLSCHSTPALAQVFASACNPPRDLARPPAQDLFAI